MTDDASTTTDTPEPDAAINDVDHGIDIRLVVAIIIAAAIGALFLNLLATGML